ncbi:MAG: hypothetical protein JJE55_08045 [Flavobacteriaceae bacterium]|nr:hypothetical protein [Flavobacteriaceae bacterium]
MESPFEYYGGKLGVKISYLTTNKSHHSESIKAVPYRTLRYRMNSENFTEKQLRKPALNMDALILFSSLSREIKDRLTTKFGHPKEAIKTSWFAQHYTADRKAFDFYVGHRYGQNNQEKLDLKLVEQYTYNASVLNTVLEMKTNRKAYAKALGGVSIDIWESLSNDVNAFREIEHNLPATRDGLRRKASKYQKEGYKSLISGKLQNSNAKKVTEKEQMALLDELLAKHTNLDNELIATLYNVVADKMNWPEITAMTVSNRNTKSKLVTHAGRNGVKSLKSNVLMQVKRKRPSAPMLYWTLDGWDVELLYQSTATDKKGHSVTTYHNRLTMVVVLDAFNNYPVGYAIGTHETPELIKNAVQNAMQHARQLFGHYYQPYQLQSDNYSIKALRPMYEAVTPHFTPAEVGNAKAKVIEPYFNALNKKYCKLLDNWSGHNTDSGSKNQPNSEFLQKIKKNFPDQDGCIAQIKAMMAKEMTIKRPEFAENWINTKPQHRQIMTTEAYLLTFGSITGMTNKLTGEGLVIKLDGEKRYFDSFDLNFRNQSHQDWQIHFDANDLSHVLAVSKDGSERHILQEKYVQPMALADRTEEDPFHLKQIRDFNKNAVAMIIETRAENSRILEPFLNQPALNDTLAKHLLTDSLGQHKNHKSAERIAANKQALKIEAKETKKEAKTFLQQQEEYYATKVDVNQYID